MGPHRAPCFLYLRAASNWLQNCSSTPLIRPLSRFSQDIIGLEVEFQPSCTHPGPPSMNPEAPREPCSSLLSRGLGGDCMGSIRDSEDGCFWKLGLPFVAVVIWGLH